jgi:hypothetical protein
MNQFFRTNIFGPITYLRDMSSLSVALIIAILIVLFIYVRDIWKTERLSPEYADFTDTYQPDWESPKPCEQVLDEVLTIVESGGFVGMINKLKIRPDGSWTYSDKNNKTAIGNLSDSDIVDYKTLADAFWQLQSYSFAARKGMQGNDMITYYVQLRGRVIDLDTLDKAPPNISKAVLSLLYMGKSRLVENIDGDGVSAFKRAIQY